jgi:catechol 2,3-dioxygenase-like lactoylglutathione lyase family enzyme
MSRLLGEPIHQCYVYPDFDAALKRFAAAGIGPFFVLGEGSSGMSLYRGEEHEVSIKAAFVFTGNSCFEIISPVGEQQSTYSEFLRKNPTGGLHHIAYYSDDFAATLASLADAGTPFTVVQDFRRPGTDQSMEIYCEPDGIDNPIHYQFMPRGLFDTWFDAMREAAANWDGTEPYRDARPLLAAAFAQAASNAA